MALKELYFFKKLQKSPNRSWVLCFQTSMWPPVARSFAPRPRTWYTYFAQVCCSPIYLNKSFFCKQYLIRVQTPFLYHNFCSAPGAAQTDSSHRVKKEKTMSISKHVDDHNTTGIAPVSIRDLFRPCSRDSSGGRTTRKPN